MATRIAPVTLAQFREAFHAIWRPSAILSTANHKQGHLIGKHADWTCVSLNSCVALDLSGNDETFLGIAISGGVDSMALAHLCSQLQKNERKGDGVTAVRFRAFIVDHNFRPDSAKEAREVAVEMRKMGIPATVLRFHTQHDGNYRRQNFETEARRLRYRALGMACRAFRLRSLLCAHHNDDQAETVLMRILNRKIAVGLQGIKPANILPECHYIYGVAESGDILPKVALPEYLFFADDQGNIKHGMPITMYLGEAKDRSLLRIADGGITLYRPLLEFSKSQLIATCEQSSLPWHEDPSNQDLNLTVRNAVRSLLASNRLPRALRKSALLKLNLYWCQIVKARNDAANALFNMLDIQRFYLRSSYLKINMNNSILSQVANIHIAARLLEKILLLVSPEVAVPPDRLSRAIRILFPRFATADVEKIASESVDSCGLDHSGHITCGGVRWTRLQPTRKRQIRVVCPWVLTREPFPKDKRENTICYWPVQFNTPKESVVPVQDSTRLPTWNWQLWDNRFWLRPSHPTLRKIIVRPLGPDDLRDFRYRLRNRKIRERLDRLLQVIAPGSVRFTLPALAENVEGPILGLPTLKIYDDFLGAELNCKVRYKKINLPQP